MLKDILLKTAQIINRDDLIEALENNSNSQLVNNDILRLISYYNYVIETLCESYFFVTKKQSITSDKNRKINYLNFSEEPTKILQVKKNASPVFFSEYSKYILVPEPNTSYEITYNYILERKTNLTDQVSLPKGVSEKIICYGIASEFLASKNKFEDADYWNNKFMYEIFKSKASKNRIIKKTYTI